MTSRLVQVGLVLLIAGPIILSLFYPPVGLSPEDSFTSTYSGVVVVETLALLSVIVLAVPPLARSLGPLIGRGVSLGMPAKAVAALAMVAGLFLFFFWAGLDALSGYESFPSYALTTYPATAEVYNALGLGVLPIPDKYHLIGIVGFLVAGAGFFVLRLDRGLGTALKDVVAYFAAPVVILFELLLWAAAPAEMYWHATYFTPWSIEKPINADQFEVLTRTKDFFAWGGNVYLVSNWFALAAAAGLLGVAVAFTMHRKSQSEEEAVAAA